MANLLSSTINNYEIKTIVLLFLILAFPNLVSSQDTSTKELHFEVNRNHPPISITKENLQEAHSLIDLNSRYEAAWVKEYISVEILTTHNGNTRKALSKNDVLSQEQKDNMNTADLKTNIDVKVRYLPDNTLKHNDIKENGFTFTIDPEIEAKYCGGKEQLTQYLKENAIDKIPEDVFVNYDLAAIKFTIDEEGLVKDAEVFWTSEDDKTDEILLKTIRNMPSWKSAEYNNGTKVKQEFVLTVGNMENCMVNLLNIDPDMRKKEVEDR